MNDPTLVADLFIPILCTAARLTLAALADPICPYARKLKHRLLTRTDRFTRILAALSPILLATSTSSDLLALLVLAHPDLYSIEHACTLGHIPLLNIWRLLAATRRVPLPLTYSSTSLDLASALGHTHVLDWWLASPLEIKYTHLAVHMAVVNAHPGVVRWWLAHAPRITLKAQLAPLLTHAIANNLGAALHRWIDYGLPIDRFDHDTNRNVFCEIVDRKAWTMLDWWARARALGIVYPVDSAEPHACPIVDALECCDEGVFEWWVGAAEMAVPEGLDAWILDAASAGGLPEVLEWWAANRGITHYSAVAMDLASFGTPMRWAGRPEAFYVAYPSISAQRRIAVLDWWRNKSGVPLKYSPDSALAMLEQSPRMHTRVTGRPSALEVFMPVLQWWVHSGLELDWKTNAKPETWDPMVRRWWEREYLKLEESEAEGDKQLDFKSRRFSVSAAFVRMTGGFRR